MFRKTLFVAISMFVSSMAVANDHSLEPAINGGVSASGNFPSQEMEEQVYACFDWRSHQRNHLFRIASKDIKRDLGDRTS